MTLHDSETVIGRITKTGSWDRRYGKRCDHGGKECPHIYRQAQFATHPDDATLREFFAAMVVCLLCGIGFYAYFAIAAATQVPAP